MLKFLSPQDNIIINNNKANRFDKIEPKYLVNSKKGDTFTFKLYESST